MKWTDKNGYAIEGTITEYIEWTKAITKETPTTTTPTRKISKKMRWLKEEDDLLRQKYRNTSYNKLLAMLPHRHKKSIMIRAHKLGLTDRHDKHPYTRKRKNT